MKYYSLFVHLILLLMFLFVTISGCASTPPPLMPSSEQVIGLAVIPQTKVAEKAVGQKEYVIIQNKNQNASLFSVLEMNKQDAPITSFDDYVIHDFVVKWKIRDQKKMDRSQLYLRLNKPRTFIYESHLGGMTKKYVIKVETNDAKTVWNAIGITPPGL